MTKIDEHHPDCCTILLWALSMLFFLIHLVSSPGHAEEYSNPQRHIHDFIDMHFTNTTPNQRRWNHFLNNPQNNWIKRHQEPQFHWLAQKKISQKDIHFLKTTQLHILPNIVPSAQDMSRLLQNRSLVTGQIPQKVLEECNKTTVFPASVLYTTGTYEISKALLHCTQNIEFYPVMVSKITAPLNQKNSKMLFEVTIDKHIDSDSIQNLIQYQGSVTILGKKVPQWLLEQIGKDEYLAHYLLDSALG